MLRIVLILQYLRNEFHASGCQINYFRLKNLLKMLLYYRNLSVRRAGVISVMAADQNDNRAPFSNYGTCTTVYASGVNIISTYTQNRYAMMSGTSMAAPQVAAVLNHYLDQFPYLTSTQLIKLLLTRTTPRIIINNPTNTPNLLTCLARYDQ